MAELQNTLPAGWECQFDRKSGKYYYINHYTKTTTWEDPRLHYKQRHHIAAVPIENIPLQHGSPEFRRNYVYPSQTTPIPAFQIPANYSPKSIPLQDMNNMMRNSPRVNRVQDSSLSTVSNTEESVGKISSMFPTVSDTHIRLLLKKYHNREVVVISALQVEKHPITTPGPFATPPPTRNIHPSVHVAYQMTPPLGIRFGSRGGSPVLRPGSGASDPHKNSPKPHSPKLKLRYMKSIFPKADETMILDILSSNENNIQKASDALKEMGFEKRDSLKLPQKTVIGLPKPIEEPRPSVSAVPKMKTLSDKKILKTELQAKYEDIPEQVIIIALESVDYDEERANQILQIMQQEESAEIVPKPKETNLDEITEVETTVQPSLIPLSQSRQSLKTVLKTEKSDYSLKDSSVFSRVIEEPGNIRGTDYRSENFTNTFGANRNLVKGPNHELLLEDYIKWQGPQPVIRSGQKTGLAKGPNSSLISSRCYRPSGPNIELRKGPKFGLAKGSLFSQFKGVVVDESRGK